MRLPCPYDQQLIWSFVLRKTLATLLVNDQRYKQKTSELFFEAVSQIIKEQRSALSDDLSNFYLSNQNFIERLKKQIQTGSPRLKNQRLNRVLQKERIRHYWQDQGYLNYCKYLSSFKNNPIIHWYEIEKLCHFLKINLDFYSKERELLARIQPRNTHVQGQIQIHCKHWQPLEEENYSNRKHQAIWQHGVPQFLFAQKNKSEQPCTNNFNQRKTKTLIILC